MKNRSRITFSDFAKLKHNSLALPLMLCFFISGLTSCQSVTPRPNTSANQPSQALPEEVVNEVQNLMYEKEGFVSKDTYVVIIVHPFSNAPAGAEIQNQAKKRAFTSLLKYKHAQGKILSQNGTTQLVNIINEHGTLTKIDDTEKKRSVYQFVVKKDNLKQYVDSL